MTRKQVDIEIAHMLELFQGATAKGGGYTGLLSSVKSLNKDEIILQDYILEKKRRKKK